MYKKKLICANIMSKNYFFFTSHSLDPNIINSGLILKVFNLHFLWNFYGYILCSNIHLYVNMSKRSTTIRYISLKN